VRNNLLEAFIAKRDEYPATRADAIELINKYDEKKVPTNIQSEGMAFAQKGKREQKRKREMMAMSQRRTSSRIESVLYAGKRGIV
jgi:hypothetical protein